MAQDITLLGANYSAVPSVLLPKTGGGTAQFDDTTIAANAAAASDINNGKLAWVNGNLIVGTGSGGGGTGGVTQDQDGFIILDNQGGGTAITPLNVTQNGTYTAPSGQAYSPVTVNVSGGGGGVTLIDTEEVTVNTTNTAATTVETFQIPRNSNYNKDDLYLCVITDKAGRRNGYFYQTFNAIVYNSSVKQWTRYITSTGGTGSSGTFYGVYLSGFSYSTSNDNFTATVSSRYSASYGTINGTYSVKFYHVDSDVLAG